MCSLQVRMVGEGEGEERSSKTSSETQGKLLFSYFLLRLHGQGVCGGQRIAVWSWFSPPTFTWVPGIGHGLTGLWSRRLYA